MDQVAKSVAECSGCDTDDSKEGYKVRTGEHNPPGVEPKPIELHAHPKLGTSADFAGSWNFFWQIVF